MIAARAEESERYLRFNLILRIEHWLLVLTFTGLAVTGLPQMFASSSVGAAMLRWFGGLEQTQIIHRATAVAFGTLTILHLGQLIFWLVCQGRRMPILPGWKDVRDFLQEIGYNLGLCRTKPRADWFNYAEKMEYWSLIWGAVVMGLTGLVMWDATKVEPWLPHVVLPVAKAIHGYEALLAVLAILIWHVYHVHIRHFNRSMFRGWITRKELEEEHPLALERLERRQLAAVPSAGAAPAITSGGALEAPVRPRRRRTAWLLSVATVLGLTAASVWWVLGDRIGTYLASEQQVTATAAPARTTVNRPDQWGPPVTHPIEDRSHCLACHGAGAPVEGPRFILKLPESSCGSCHGQPVRVL